MSLNWSNRDPEIAALSKTTAESSSSLEGVIAVAEQQFSSSTSIDQEDTGESKRKTGGVEVSGSGIGQDNVLCGEAPVVVTTDTSVFTISTLLSPPTPPTPTNVQASSTMAGIKTEMQPLHTVTNSTVSAAADSSDNQPSTPTPDHQALPPPSSSSSSSTSSSLHHQHHLHQQHQQQQQAQQQHHHHHHQQQQPHHHHPLYGSSGGAGLANPNQMYQDMHSYHPPGAGYLGGYEQFYHAPPAGVDYGSAMQQLQQNQALSYQMQNQSLAATPGGHTDYKVMATSQRFHPYLNNGGLHHLSPVASASQNSHSSNPVAVNANGGAAPNNTSSSVSNSSLSPRVVSSSSPSQNNSAANHTMAEVKSMSNRTPTPSASKQCNKCGILCATEAELSEHYTSIHGAPTSEDCINSAAERSASSASERGQYHPFAPYIKEEPPSSDILDLDSQKMVYPPQPEDESAAAAAAVNAGMLPMQRPMTWPQDIHPAYMPGPPHLAAENKHAGYYSKQDFATIKSEFHPIKSEYVSPTNFGITSLKPSINSVEYGQPIAPQTRPDDKPFGSTDLATGNNPVSSSPSEFPSTTTPQDNITQYRNFEPPSSSLPSSGSSAKSATWKSNEARRPKTYNCTACNKWFTSSGHLKRHYNTTLHKNAVKSSGQPDPATMPISAHHHPARDPNSKHHRNSQARQPPPIPPEPPRSPDFSSQYTAQSPNGFSSQAQQQQQQQQQQSQTFQQYHPQSNLNGHPNGLAGPSVQASQPRGLLTISSTEVSIMDREEEQLHNTNSSNNNSLQLQEEQYHHQELQGSSPNNSPSSSNNNSSSLEEEYQSAISLHQPQQQRLLPPLQSPHIISHHQYREVHPIHHHQQEPTTIFNTATTIHNIMDQQQQQPPQQQQYIINPLAINTTTPITLNNTTTTIPSYQHLQQQVAEHQQNYPTIIGNDNQELIQLNSFVDIASLANVSSYPSNTQQSQMQQQMVALDANGHIVQLIHQPSMIDLQRYTGGIPSFKENLMQAPSPTVPESYYSSRMSPFGAQSSPQEADIPPMHTTAAAPQQNDQTNPYSPTVSSSTTNQLSNGDEPSQTIRKQAVKRKRESTTTTTNATSTTLPTGRLKCEECNKEFTKICYLTQHNKSFHSGEQPYRCQKCGKRFQSEEIYESHLDRHKSQDKPHKCDVCPKQFHHKTDLRRHKEAIHTGFKAHTCDLCNKSFCRKDHLRKHSDIHMRPKPPKKVKAPPASRRKTAKAQANETQSLALENDSPLQAISSVEDNNNSDSSSNNSSLLPQKFEIVKVESFAMAGQDLVYM
ncbi:myb-like protein Q [Eupeodes corollae]|uniref:myb-like protein Q n=1 Tax=Eupeodes corollae TaxID=290404 RepID=UPI0024909C1B|nr:myb-like protein Q [Eupeodes corollae]